MVKVRDKLEQITLRILDYAHKWDSPSPYSAWDNSKVNYTNPKED